MGNQNSAPLYVLQGAGTAGYDCQDVLPLDECSWLVSPSVAVPPDSLQAALETGDMAQVFEVLIDYHLLAEQPGRPLLFRHAQQAAQPLRALYVNCCAPLENNRIDPDAWVLEATPEGISVTLTNECEGYRQQTFDGWIPALQALHKIFSGSAKRIDFGDAKSKRMLLHKGQLYVHLKGSPGLTPINSFYIEPRDCGALFRLEKTGSRPVATVKTRSSDPVHLQHDNFAQALNYLAEQLRHTGYGGGASCRIYVRGLYQVNDWVCPDFLVYKTSCGTQAALECRSDLWALSLMDYRGQKYGTFVHSLATALEELSYILEHGRLLPAP